MGNYPKRNVVPTHWLPWTTAQKQATCSPNVERCSCAGCESSTSNHCSLQTIERNVEWQNVEQQQSHSISSESESANGNANTDAHTTKQTNNREQDCITTFEIRPGDFSSAPRQTSTKFWRIDNRIGEKLTIANVERFIGSQVGRRGSPETTTEPRTETSTETRTETATKTCTNRSFVFVLGSARGTRRGKSVLFATPRQRTSVAVASSWLPYVGASCCVGSPTDAKKIQIATAGFGRLFVFGTGSSRCAHNHSLVSHSTDTIPTLLPTIATSLARAGRSSLSLAGSAWCMVDVGRTSIPRRHSPTNLGERCLVFVEQPLHGICAVGRESIVSDRST